MNRFAMAFLAFLAYVGTAQAALPPLYQSTAEIKALMTDDRLGEKLQSGELITGIQKNDQGYEIITNQHRLQVNVDYLPGNRPGPAKFNLRFEEPAPLTSSRSIHP